MPVVDAAGRLVGIVTDRDVRRALPSPLMDADPTERDAMVDNTPVSRVMTREPLTVEPGSPLTAAVRLICERKIGALPVVDDGRLVGIFTQTDALRAFLDVLT